MESNATLLLTAGGRIVCRRCQAMSKRTRLQCAAPASQGKSVCRFHGGRSTGPKSDLGRRRCAEAKTIHGRETRAKRERGREVGELLKVYAEILGVGYSFPRLPFPRSNGHHFKKTRRSS
jgi:hypothetical protein